jgi:hypothetical protein
MRLYKLLMKILNTYFNVPVTKTNTSLDSLWLLTKLTAVLLLGFIIDYLL